jgi:HAMP domain-containing protein
MEENTTNNGFNPNPQMVQNNNTPKSKNKSLVLLVILVVILFIILVLNTQNQKEMAELDNQITQVQTDIRTNDEITKQIETQGSSDEITEIEKDLNAISIDTIDQ